MSQFKCDACGFTSEKPKSELKRNLETDKKNFCSRTCSAKYNNVHRTVRKHAPTIQLESSNRRDEHSIFRYTFRCVKRRFKDVDLTLEDLKELWNKQKGLCAYTNLPLILPEEKKIDGILQQIAKDPTTRASLDRIDPNLGYIKGNVQFVSTSINYMKNDMSHEKTLEFLKFLSSLSFDKD